MRTPSPAAAHTSRTMINFVMQTWLFLMTHAEIYIVFADFPMSASSSDTPSASVPPQSALYSPATSTSAGAQSQGLLSQARCDLDLLLGSAAVGQPYSCSGTNR